MTGLSLRARLLLATVSLVALGLLVASAATYGVLRSSLLGRVDDQLRSGATLAGARELFTPERGPFARPRRGPASAVTYAGLIDLQGRVTTERAFGFVANEAPPEVPAAVVAPIAAGAPERFFTTGARDGSAVRYRALAVGLRGGGAVVLAIPLDEVSATLRRLLAVQVGVSLAVLTAVAGAALWLVRVGMQPLARMEQVAADIAAGDLTRRVDPADDRTEVGRLGSALNTMLTRIESAFTERAASEARLRRFVADASHELRTPLTSIRGYAELFRHGAATDPDGLATAMRRIEEESTRMSGLVEEMLLLARLDQGRPLERAHVDLAAIAADAVADARAVQPDRAISLDAPASAPVLGDAARLRQVAANLLSNALAHTPVHADVRASVTASGVEVALEVVDEGPGMEPAHAERAFDRFFRADPARTRDAGGAGLGLSIARAIVEAHGGSVSLESAPSAGTRVTVRLPRADQPDLTA